MTFLYTTFLTQTSGGAAGGVIKKKKKLCKHSSCSKLNIKQKPSVPRVAGGWHAFVRYNNQIKMHLEKQIRNEQFYT